MYVHIFFFFFLSARVDLELDILALQRESQWKQLLKKKGLEICPGSRIFYITGIIACINCSFAGQHIWYQRHVWDQLPGEGGGDIELALAVPGALAGERGLWRWINMFSLYRAKRESIRSQTIHIKGTAYDITKYQTFLTKYGIVSPFKRTSVNIRRTAYNIL